MTMASWLMASTMSMSLRSRCSKVGLAMNLPSTRPTRTPAKGPAQGMSLSISAAEQPVMPSTSVSFILSAEMTHAMSWVSFW